jgi:hypothetical protein
MDMSLRQGFAWVALLSQQLGHSRGLPGCPRSAVTSGEDGSRPPWVDDRLVPEQRGWTEPAGGAVSVRKRRAVRACAGVVSGQVVFPLVQIRGLAGLLQRVHRPAGFLRAEHRAAPAAGADGLHCPFVQLGDRPAMFHQVTIAHYQSRPPPQPSSRPHEAEQARYSASHQLCSLPRRTWWWRVWGRSV